MSKAPTRNDPLAADDANSLLRAVLKPHEKKIAIAVSGGADSMALLWLAQQLLPQIELVALTVDHGLRAGSAKEAAMVKSWCAANKIHHETLSWHGSKPAKGVQAAARNARYSLLAAACEKHTIDALWTAHHADDQAETTFARLARGAGIDGLAAMAPVRLIAAGAGPEVRLCRPMLTVTRKALQAIAGAAELPVSHDPSNDDPHFERVRRRAFLSAMGVQGFLSHEALLLSAQRAREAQQLQEAMLAESFARCEGYVHGSGAICLAAKKLQIQPEAQQILLLRRIIEAVSGAAHGPGTEEVAALLKQNLARATLGGALISRNTQEIWVMREPSALLGRADGQAAGQEIPVEAGGKTLWDNRFVVSLSAQMAGQGLKLAPIGTIQTGVRHRRELAATMPALWRDGKIIALPPYAKKIINPADAPWNAPLTALDTRLLTAERLFRRVLRFPALST